MSQAIYRNIEDGASDGYLAKLIRYRHLFWNLIASDLRARFRGRRLGILWALLQPIGFTLMIAYVWGLLFDREFTGFALHVMSGLIVWEFFTGSMTRGLHALTFGKGYLRQAPLPLFILQARVPFADAATFLLGTVGFIGLQLAYGQVPPLSPSLLLVAPFVAIVIVLAIPLSMIFSLFGTAFRDLQHITALVLRALFFCSPILAENDRFDQAGLDFLRWANPLMPLTNLFRDPAIHGVWWDPFDLLVVTLWAIVLWSAALIVAALFGRRIVYSL